MLYLVHRVTISIKLRPVKLEQAVSESLPHKGLHTELLGVQLTCLDPVPASIRARNAQEINITNCDVTTWSWVNLVPPVPRLSPYANEKSKERGSFLLAQNLSSKRIAPTDNMRPKCCRHHKCLHSESGEDEKHRQSQLLTLYQPMTPFGEHLWCLQHSSVKY